MLSRNKHRVVLLGAALCCPSFCLGYITLRWESVTPDEDIQFYTLYLEGRAVLELYEKEFYWRRSGCSEVYITATGMNGEESKPSNTLKICSNGEVINIPYED